jgi:4-hydroxy-tetrahydrodipicolinate synthase
MSNTHSSVAFAGFAPAIPTPFDDNDHIDTEALERFCDWQIEEGASALVVCGTTGEAPTLTPAEHDTIVRAAVNATHGRVPVVAGAGSNSTRHAIELAKTAQAAGADALLSVVPYYNRPTQAGLLAHFRAIAASADVPILLYDVPPRTGCSLADATLARLAENSNIVGLKDASGDIGRPLRLRRMLRPEFLLFSGDDASALEFIARGGDGCISVTSNVVPDFCRRLYAAWRDGRTDDARRMAHALADLTGALFKETNPVPVKYALSLLNCMPARVRLPLVELAHDSKAAVAAALPQFRGSAADRQMPPSAPAWPMERGLPIS